MIYSRKITGNESEAFRLLIDRIIGIQGLTHFPRIPIGEVRVVTESFDRFAGSGKLVLRKPYLADKDDLIAFDKTTQTIVYNFKYIFEGDGTEGGSTKTLIIGLRWFSSNWVVYPIAAVLMHAANDIDISDDNFRAWLINNRPKVNKVGKMDIPEENNELFKFLQLRELADNVKITQEMGQALFKALLDRANAIAHEEVSGDALATDTSEFVLALVNNLINSANPAPPKPTIFQRVEADEINNMPREYEECRTRLVPRWNASYIFVPITDDVAEKCFGKPSVESREGNMWFFKVDGVLCKAFGRGQLSIAVSHRPFAEVRKALDRILEVVNEEMNGKK